MEQSSDHGAAGNAVAIENLSRRFRRVVALDDFSLAVPEGCIFGLLGESGAGKTTLIKHLLGLLKPQTGSVRVFGRDPVRDPKDVLGRIGYLSEDRDMPHWMKVGELMRYTEGFYPKWDEKFAAELLETFRLDPQQKVRTLSRGQKAKTGLLIAIAHRPELLILDEPSTGLDAVARKDILEAIMRTIAREGRTVFFSSHLLDEVERVADHVAIVNRGRLLTSDKLDAILGRYNAITIRFPQELGTAPKLAGALSCEGSGTDWTVVCDGKAEEVKTSAASLNAQVVSEDRPSLEQVFVALVGSRPVEE